MNRIVPAVFAALLLLFSCTQPEDKLTATSGNKTVSQFELQERERLKKRAKIEKQEEADSLCLVMVLAQALDIATKEGKDVFKKQYQTYPGDSMAVDVELRSGYQFSSANPHLIIRRSTQGAYYLDIYAKHKIEYRKVLSLKEWRMSYVNDIIKDINGDGRADLVVNWYGSTGCCLKGFSKVFLLRADQRTFAMELQFINPTFSPEEKIIRGVCYGHPGETAMYKYRWNGEKVDTVEYISFEEDEKGARTGRVVVSDRRPFAKQTNVIKIIPFVPLDYMRIEGYDWFTGKKYN